jgi:parvulin-like peptidyl-prolyl isomerase
MKKQYAKALKIIFGILAILLVIFIALNFWVYSGRITPLKTQFLTKLPFPMALVNGHPILMRDFILRYNVAEKLGQAEANGQTDEQIRQQIYNQMVTDNETAQLAQSHDVSVTQKQIDAEYQKRASSADLQGHENFDALLSYYGLNNSNFKSQIIKPSLLTIAMQIWFNSQASLNQKEYNLANSLVQRIQKGEDMAQLAKQYTQDPTGQSVEGDLGFVQVTELLPELQETVDGMTTGSVKIIPSKFGLHIVKLEQKIGNLYHLREIFLTTESYNNWFASQAKNFNIKKLLTT